MGSACAEVLDLTEGTVRTVTCTGTGTTLVIRQHPYQYSGVELYMHFGEVVVMGAFDLSTGVANILLPQAQYRTESEFAYVLRSASGQVAFSSTTPLTCASVAWGYEAYHHPGEQLHVQYRQGIHIERDPRLWTAMDRVRAAGSVILWIGK